MVETTAAGAVLAQFYAGRERILKRIAQFTESNAQSEGRTLKLIRLR